MHRFWGIFSEELSDLIDSGFLERKPRIARYKRLKFHLDVDTEQQSFLGLWLLRPDLKAPRLLEWAKLQRWETVSPRAHSRPQRPRL